MREIRIGDKTFPLAENWQELRPDQLLAISPYLISDTVEARLKVLDELVPRKMKPLYYRLRPAQVYDLTTCIDWLWEYPLDQPIIGSFYAGAQVYLLPQRQLNRCNAIEYAYADTYFEAVMAGDSSKLDKLIAALCRPRRKDKPDPTQYDGDPRERFNPVLIEERAKLMESLPVNFKLYFLLFFIGCKKALAAKYAPLFRSREDAETDIPTAPNFGMLGVIWDIAGGLAMEEEIQYSPLHNVFAYLTKRYYDNERLKEEQKRHAVR